MTFISYKYFNNRMDDVIADSYNKIMKKRAHSRKAKCTASASAAAAAPPRNKMK